MPARRLDLPAPIATVPFTRRVGQSYGLRPSSFRSRGVRRLAPAVFQALDADAEPALRTVAAAQLHSLPPGLLVEGLSALQLLGVELGPREPLRLCAPDGHQVKRHGVRVRRLAAPLPALDRVLTPCAAFATAAVDLDLVELVVAGDWLVRLGRTTPTELRAFAAGLTGRHCRTVRRAAELVRERVDSPPESRLRLCLVLAGLPEPAVNLDLGDEWFFLARPDLAYLRYRLLLEYEGDQHRTDRRQWNRDIDRTRYLTRQGYVVERVTAERLRRPRRLVQEIHQVLRSQGYEGPAPAFPAAWRSHFEPTQG